MHTNLSLNELTQHYAQLRRSEADAECNYKAFKKDIDAKIYAVQAEILARMDAEGKTKFSTSVGDFTKVTKTQCSLTSTAEMEKAILANPELVKFMSLKAKSTEVKKYVEANGETPTDLIRYERFFEIAFRKA